MARVKLGDIFEIETSKGKAYLHFVLKDKMMGSLVRVLPGLFSSKPEKLCDLVKKQELYVIFFPLSAASKRGLVKHVGNFKVDFEKPKYMRDKHIIGNEFLGWHIVDTSTWENKLVKNLTDDQRKMSPWGIWNDALLIERLEEEWSPEYWT